jgi:uncharacterized membrane protein (DUF2068 family)
VRERLEAFAMGSGREAIVRLLGELLRRQPHDLALAGAGLLAYAGVFTIEGVGLLRDRPWAEWLTAGVTWSFVPFEVYECVERGSLLRIAILVANVAVAIYLTVRRIRDHRRHRRHRRGKG